VPPPKDKDSILVFLILLNSISLIIESTNSGIKLSTLENLLKSQYGQITSQKGI
jgi:Trk-type K+ transport system membrane component